MYINRGLGVVRYPVRFNARPEITVFTLRRDAV
jgi:predicted MPP superfamily phosphohydrolase